MSLLPIVHAIQVQRGATWEGDAFQYSDANDVPVDLTGYEARMQIRTMAGRYGTSTSDTLLMELTTANGRLIWNTAAEGRIEIAVSAADTVILNPSNARKVKLAYALEVFLPGATERVIPLAIGVIDVHGEITR